MSTPLSTSPTRVALWTAPNLIPATVTGEAVSISGYRSFALVVAPDVQGQAITGTFTYELQIKLPGGVVVPGINGPTVTTTTGDIWVAVQSGTHDLADGALVIRDTDSPYRDVRLSATFGSIPSHQVNAWAILKKD